MSQALYRKYRSRNLEEIVGQDHITSALKGALKKGMTTHAYLLTGPRGVGKTSIARILAHEINGLAYDDDATDLDIVEIDAASNRRIDDIRDLREKVHIAPSHSKFKVYIIDEVHMLTGESFNALLKTLEEPPQHVVFILATTEIDKLPATIVSRTQTFRFRLISTEDMVRHLRTIADAEQIAINDEALTLLARRSEGSFRDGINLLDQVRHLSAKEITAEMVETALGFVPHAVIAELLEAITSKQPAVIARSLQVIEDSGMSTGTLVRQLLDTIHEQVTTNPALLPLFDSLLEVPKSYLPSAKLLSVLLQASQPEPKSKQATLATSPLVLTLEEPTPPPKKPATPKASPQSQKPTTKTDTAPSMPATKKGKVSEFDWGKLVTHAKENFIVLHSVLSKCGYTFESDTLTIYTKFKLHKTKLDDPRYRTMLYDALNGIFGAAPEIAIVFGPKPLTDTQALEVAQLMGGGEEVSVS